MKRGSSGKVLPMICASKWLPSIISSVFETLAMKGVAISGMVYVPIPAYIELNNCRVPRKRKGLAYLVINELLSFIVLPEHGEELDDIGILEVLILAWWGGGASEVVSRIRTSSLNWSPVPSKQSTIVRCSCVGGMISSRWYLSSRLLEPGELLTWGLCGDSVWPFSTTGLSMRGFLSMSERDMDGKERGGIVWTFLGPLISSLSS